MILFMRRRKLGKGSTTGMTSWLRSMQVETSAFLHERLSTLSTQDSFGNVMLVRWGCVATTPSFLTPCVTINKSPGIHKVNNKKDFRLLLQDQEISVPRTISSQIPVSFASFPMVVRPSRHLQGRNLWLVNNLGELLQVTSQLGDEWYASTFIDKVAEYRVYVVNGRVATVARKTPANPAAAAWNVAQGGRFDVVRWSDWPMEVCRVAIEAFSLSGLDFSGVDVMVDREGAAYVIEANSAPSLPGLSDGSISYRQKCMAKCFKYIYENGTELEPATYAAGYRGVIHPAVLNGD